METTRVDGVKAPQHRGTLYSTEFAKPQNNSEATTDPQSSAAR